MMKKNIYVCLNCKRAFEDIFEDHVVCPYCRNDSTIETYEYDLQDVSNILAEDIIVRLDLFTQKWFYSMALNTMLDLFNAEKEIKCRCLGVHYPTISVINNIIYLIDKLNEWKKQQLISNEGIIFFEGNPGCLVLDSDWKMIVDLLMSVKNDAERILSTVEFCMNSTWKKDMCNVKEPNWENLEELITKALRNTLTIYRFFKNGVDIGLRY
jgi:hypothetical protein